MVAGRALVGIHYDKQKLYLKDLELGTKADMLCKDSFGLINVFGERYCKQYIF